jgi:hypothetical protein
MVERTFNFNLWRRCRCKVSQCWQHVNESSQPRQQCWEAFSMASRTKSMLCCARCSHAGPPPLLSHTRCAGVTSCPPFVPCAALRGVVCEWLRMRAARIHQRSGRGACNAAGRPLVHALPPLLPARGTSSFLGGAKSGIPRECSEWVHTLRYPRACLTAPAGQQGSHQLRGRRFLPKMCVVRVTWAR